MIPSDQHISGDLKVPVRWKLVYAGVAVFAVATMCALWLFAVIFTP